MDYRGIWWGKTFTSVMENHMENYMGIEFRNFGLGEMVVKEPGHVLG